MVPLFNMLNPKVKDIITFKSENNFITHIVVEAYKGTYITKGDANNIEDDKISKSDIIGKVIFSGGILNIIIDYKYAIIGVIVTLYLICWIIAIIKSDKDEKKEVKI